MMTERLIRILILLLTALASAGGAAEITGRIIDSRTKEPLIGVNVVVMEQETGAATDVEGRFRITGMNPGTYRIKCTYIGYESVIRTDIIVASARPAFVKVAMQQSYVELQELVVRPEYFVDALEISASSTFLSREEIRRFPGGFEDVVRTVATLPGVSAVNEGGRNDLLVRGGGPSENLYLVNGIPVPNINHFGNQGSSSGALSFVNLDLVENVEFSTGGFSSKYGDKMSSVLAIETRPGRDDHFGGKVTVSASQFGATFEGPIGNKGNFQFSARESYLDLIFKLAGQAFVPIYTDFNLIASYDLTARDRFSVLGLLALDRIDRDLTTPENRVQNADLMDNTQTQIASGMAYRRLFPSGYFDLSLNLNHNKFRFSQSDLQNIPYYDSNADETELGLRALTYINLNSESGLYFGASALGVDNKNVTAFADTIYDRSGRQVTPESLGLTRETLTDTSALKFGLFAEWEQTILSRISMKFGLRGDIFSFLEQPFYPSARLSLDYKPLVRFRIKTSVGRYFQSPSYVWTINQFNKNLKALKNDMLILGFDYLLRDDTNLSLETYYKRYSDLPTGTIPGVTDYLVLTNTGVGFGGREDDFQSFGYFDMASDAKGKAYGLELLLQKKYSTIPLYGQISLAYGKSEYTAGNGRVYPGQFDQRVIFNLVAGYKFNRKWEISGKFRYFTGAPYTPVYKPQDNNGLVQNLPEEYLTARLDAGHHLDLRVDRRFNFRRWTMILFLDIQNLYAYEIPTRPRYDFWEDSIETTNSITILPSIGISAEF